MTMRIAKTCARAVWRWCQFLVLPAALSGQTVVDVPRAAAPTIDGHVTPAEWNGSSVQRLADGSEVLLRHDGRYVYLGLRAASEGFLSACVSRGDTVRVLHASAALGTALYVRTDTTWALTSPFTWEMRAREMNDDTRRRQQEYLVSARWLGSTFGLSTTQKEMQIDLALLEPGDPRLAFGYYVASDRTVVPWPGSLTDACPDQQVVAGFLPPSARFGVHGWARLRLGS